MGQYYLLYNIRNLEIMKVKEYTNNKNYIHSKKEIKLLTKKDLLVMVEPQYHDEFKKWAVKDLREYFNITHKVDGEYIDARCKCFKCLTPLRYDYTQFENYCQDC